MDFFTVDTILNTRLYVFFIISHKTREIIQFSIIQYPVREFVRQQIILFTEKIGKTIYIIHDNAGEFFLKFADYNIKGITTSVCAPNMNAIAERFVRSARQEVLDHFVIFTERQIFNLLKEYVLYYNSKRPQI